jgi:hypothetical protein
MLLVIYLYVYLQAYTYRKKIDCGLQSYNRVSLLQECIKTMSLKKKEGLEHLLDAKIIFYDVINS